MLLCDHHECGSFATAPAQLSALNPVPIQDQELKFLTGAREGGWLVSMRIQFCPNHHQLLLGKAQSAIVSADGTVTPRVESALKSDTTGGKGGAGFTAD